MNDLFNRFARWAADISGTAWAFLAAALVIVTWCLTGPIFHYSDTWQLVINTSTTIVTFLMVFLIQNTQNRDSKALHLKIDELIRSTTSARNSMIDLEKLNDQQIARLQAEFDKICEEDDSNPAALEEIKGNLDEVSKTRQNQTSSSRDTGPDQGLGTRRRASANG